jgi:putative MATE family efflux protein
MHTRQQNKMGVKPVGRLLVSMALPIMLAMMIQALYNVVDSIFIAQVSEEALTAISLAFPIQMLMISVGVGTAIGVNSLLSRRLGERLYAEASAVAMNGIFLAIIIWLVFATFGAAIGPFFFQFFTADERIISMGRTYLLICTTASLGIFGQLVCERIMQGTGDTIHPMITQGIGAILNIILDPILIFGLLGFPKMGITGAAVATVIGQMTAFGLAVFFMLRKTKEITFKFRGFRPSRKIITNIYNVGMPAIVMQSIGSVMTIGMNSILTTFSATAVAVFGVYFKLQSFIFMPVFGLVTAMISIVGFNYGARQKHRITRTIRVAIFISMSVMLSGTVLFQLAPQALLRMFDASPDMLAIGTKALRIISLSFPLAAVAIVFSSSFQAMGKGMLSLIMSATRQLVVILPVAYLLAKNSGLDSVWYAFLISEAVSVSMSIVMFSQVYAKKIRVLVPLEHPQSSTPVVNPE